MESSEINEQMDLIENEEMIDANKRYKSFEIKEINLYSKLTCISSISNFNIMAIGDETGRISFYDNRMNKATKLFMSEIKKDIKY